MHTSLSDGPQLELYEQEPCQAVIRNLHYGQAFGSSSAGLEPPRASLIAQLVKNPPAMQETLVRFLGREDPLENGWVTHSSVVGLPLWLSW